MYNDVISTVNQSTSRSSASRLSLVTGSGIYVHICVNNLFIILMHNYVLSTVNRSTSGSSASRLSLATGSSMYVRISYIFNDQ